MAISAVAKGETKMSIWGKTADGTPVPIYTLTSGQIEVKYALLGDANLDGAVNGTEGFTNLPAGAYEARVYSNDSYNLLTSSTFTVSP